MPVNPLTGLLPSRHRDMPMGLFTDVLQSLHIDETAEKAESLEQRVRRLESELARTKRLLRDVVHLLEQQSQKDLDGDGRVG